MIKTPIAGASAIKEPYNKRVVGPWTIAFMVEEVEATIFAG